jgi:kumamolisin
VTVTLRGKALPSADQLTSPVTPADLASNYGADPADVERVRAALTPYGLSVPDSGVSLAGRSVLVRGTVRQMEDAFGVKLGVYNSDEQGDFRGRDEAIRVPTDLDGIVTGVFGLDERRVARRRTSPATATAPLAPSDLEARYQFPPGDGAGQQIGIAEFGGGYFASDLEQFCQKYDRAVPNVSTVSLGLPALTLAEINKLPANQRNEQLAESVEVMMDIEIVGALCPAAELFVYFAPFSQKGWIDLLNSVIDGKPSTPGTLSVSWGLAEDAPDWSSAAVNEINQRLQALSMLGVTVCVAAGDDGSGDQISDGRAHIDFPASSPFVLAVGGTKLTAAQPPVEVVWWDTPGDRADGGGSTGGGVSVIFPRPAWQTVQVPSLNAGSIDGRVIPDVSALAGEPFYDLIFDGKDSPNGGTSAAAPLWASVLARVAAVIPAGAPRRFLTPWLYQTDAAGVPNGQVGCNDITEGDNTSPQPGKGYEAGPGFDAASGWGTPNGTALAGLLK